MRKKGKKKHYSILCRNYKLGAILGENLLGAFLAISEGSRLYCENC